MSDQPNHQCKRLILLISGKRKSGKDYFAEKLLDVLGNEAIIVRISEPLKSEYARCHNLDLVQLMSDSAYKEKYRIDMVKWGEEVRANDPGYFIRAAIAGKELYRIWIVSDVRRKSDMIYFEEQYASGSNSFNNLGNSLIYSVRINASAETRTSRGWIFTPGIDDAPTECGLDDWPRFTIVICNDGDPEGDTEVSSLMEQLALLKVV